MILECCATDFILLRKFRTHLPPNKFKAQQILAGKASSGKGGATPPSPFLAAMASLEALSKYNRIINNVYAMDNLFRLICYSCALYISHSSKSPFTDWLADLKARLSETRVINRLLVGLPASIEGYLAYGDATTVEAILGRLMAFSMILYHPIEHVWWASTLKPVLVHIDGNKWSQWTCRCWVVYVVCDLIGTLRRLGQIENDTKHAKERRNLLIWLTCIAADAPLAIQWSVDHGPFSDSLLNWAGWYGGLAGLYLRWLKLG